MPTGNALIDWLNALTPREQRRVIARLKAEFEHCDPVSQGLSAEEHLGFLLLTAAARAQRLSVVELASLLPDARGTAAAGVLWLMVEEMVAPKRRRGAGRPHLQQATGARAKTGRTRMDNTPPAHEIS